MRHGAGQPSPHGPSEEGRTVKEDILSHKAVFRTYHHVHAPSGSVKLLLQSKNHRQCCEGEAARTTGVQSPLNTITNPEPRLLLMPDLGGEGGTLLEMA